MMPNDRVPTRREFFKLAGAGSVVAAIVSQGPIAQATMPGEPRKRPLELALASYTLREFDLDKTLEMTRRVGMEAACLKSFHLPLDSTAEQISAAVAKAKSAGVRIYGGGVITMKKETEVHQAFDYAKAAGMIRIMAAPSPAMLPLIEQKVRQYDIQVCIHNHGPGDADFPTPDIAYAKIKDLDRRIGICHDIGHTVRFGADAVAMTEQCADRLLDLHIKDVSQPTAKGVTVPCGRGVIDLPRVIRTLLKVGYRGYLAFEYESEGKDPLPGLAESVGYVRGVMDSIS